VLIQHADGKGENMSSNYFKRIEQGTQGTTQTGLDQLVDIVDTDFGLAGRISDADIQWGGEFADKMNAIIVEAVNQTGVAREGQFSTDAVRTINAHIRENYQEEWKILHGDDEKCREETGFHLVQNDGATSYFRGKNLVNTVADGIYHLGFEIQGGRILNEDGNANASLEQLAQWLTVFYTDRSTTQTGLDRMTDMILADKNLAKKIPESDIHQGADAANRMNEILAEALDQVLAPGDTGITISHIRAMNTYIRDNYLDEWTGLHGDDEKNGEETGFHLVQNDGAGTRMFKKNFVNTISDGVYHLGFEIQGDYILNEDGDKNASLSDLADWIQYFYMDQSDTDTGLDQLVDAVKSDQGLSCRTSAGEINEGALAANQMNHILVDAITAKAVAADSRISPDDIRAINAHIRENYFEQWKTLHGDDEKNGEETGFHLVQNDGGRIKYKTDKLINTVADGIYHLGFEI